MKIFDRSFKFIKNENLQKVCLATEILLLVIALSTLTGGEGVDFDEAFSRDIIVNNGIWGILAGTAADVHPPLYYLIVKAAFSMFGANLKVMVWVSIIPVIMGMCMASVLVKKRWGLELPFCLILSIHLLHLCSITISI